MAPSSIQTESVITCPECGHQSEETMSETSCQYFYQCDRCRKVLEPEEGDCCVFCSYGSVDCPPVQKDDHCC